jgi:hypothetical protein
LDGAGWGFGLYDGLANKGVFCSNTPLFLSSLLFLRSLLITLGGWSGRVMVGFNGTRLDWTGLDWTGLGWVGGKGRVIGRYDYSIKKLAGMPADSLVRAKYLRTLLGDAFSLSFLFYLLSFLVCEIYRSGLLYLEHAGLMLSFLTK